MNTQFPTKTSEIKEKFNKYINKQMKTKIISLVEVKTIDSKLDGLPSVRNCGIQCFEKTLNKKLFKGWAYAVTFDCNHPEYENDLEKDQDRITTSKRRHNSRFFICLTCQRHV